MDERAAARSGDPDPVAQVRRRLEELLAAGGKVTGTARGTRPDESDPQRTRPAGARDPDSGSRSGRQARPRRGAAGEPDEPGGTVEQAKDASLRLLAVRARSRAELARRLAEKGYSAEVAEAALERLAEVGLIDDADFARQWVRERHGFSGRGKRALAQELRRKGVASEDAEAALDSVTPDDEYERATELVRRKLRTLPAGLDREKAMRRLVGMLARRGYGHQVAYAVVKAEWDATNANAGIDDEPPPID